MPLKKVPCRDFQRGSCRFGDKCKFLHVTQPQPKSNVFGFGSQTGAPFQQTNLQQQKPNPFGFGIQNSGPANGAPNSGGFKQPNAFKPFENKWTRSEQPANQAAAASHKCTDPDSCKRQIAEDFELEKPLWKLTCYGHYKFLPCDITGDISYEELRAAAYDDAKRGVNLQSIVERERRLLNSKLIEFENLLRNPYTKHTNLAHPNQTPFPSVVTSTPSLTPQNSGPSPVSSVNQQGQPANLTFGVRPSMPSSSGFGQFQGHTRPFGSSSVPSGPFGTQIPAQTGGNPFTSNIGRFGNSSMSSQGTQIPTQTAGNPFTSNVAGFGNSGMSSQGTQVPVQTGGNPFASNVGGFGNSGMSSQDSQLPSTFSASSQTSGINQSPMLSNGLGATNMVQQMSTNIEPTNNIQQGVLATDASIWLKEEWKLGEIPEQPPPAAYVK